MRIVDVSLCTRCVCRCMFVYEVVWMNAYVIWHIKVYVTLRSCVCINESVHECFPYTLHIGNPVHCTHTQHTPHTRTFVHSLANTHAYSPRLYIFIPFTSRACLFSLITTLYTARAYPFCIPASLYIYPYKLHKVCMQVCVWICSPLNDCVCVPAYEGVGMCV